MSDPTALYGSLIGTAPYTTGAYSGYTKYGQSVNALAVGSNGTRYALVKSQSIYQSGTTLTATPAQVNVIMTDANGNWIKAPVSNGDANGWYSVGFSNMVAGAVDPVTGNYVFAGYEQVSPIANGDSRVMTLYEYDGSRIKAIGRVTVNTAGGTQGGNGDIAFDGKGNLYILRGSENAFTITTVTSTNLAVARQAGSASQNIVSTTSKSIPAADAAGAVGIAILPDGSLAIASSVKVWSIDPVTLAIVNPNLRTGDFSGSTGNTNGEPLTSSIVDLASCAIATTLTIEKNLPEGRADANDQFGLWLVDPADVANPYVTATTAGSASGVQPQKVGPVFVRVGGAYTVAEMAGNGFTDLRDYGSALACVIDGTSTSVPYVPGASGSVLTVPAAATGKNITCTFTNTPLKPKLVVTKSSNPASGTALVPGQSVTYTLTFDNSGGGRAATVNHTDLLADVLDDATMVGSAVAQSPLTATLSGTTLKVVGTLPAGATATVTYTVKVKDPLTANASLVNYVVPTGTTPPTTCDQATALCTVHPVTVNLSWNKVGGASARLAGSEWTLTPLDAKGVPVTAKTVVVVDCTTAPCTGVDKDADAGEFLVQGLVPGKYRLVETKAPAGYVKLTAPIDVTVNTNVAYGDIVNTKISVPGIPLTGGVGEFGYLLAGGGLGGLVLLALVMQRRRARRMAA
ncbi:MAG: DUF11 domain-containing protein [Microbacterium sp.]|nr:DUF11 domain-containing protein [Microbacterium sp.]